MAYKIMAYIVMASIDLEVIAYIVMAYIVMAYIVMADGLPSSLFAVNRASTAIACAFVQTFAETLHRRVQDLVHRHAPKRPVQHELSSTATCRHVHRRAQTRRQHRPCHSRVGLIYDPVALPPDYRPVAASGHHEPARAEWRL